MNESKVCTSCEKEKPLIKYDANNLVCKRCKYQRTKAKRILTRPEQHLWLWAKSSARKRGLPFELELADIVIPRYCPYFGTELVFDVAVVAGDDAPTVDRIDSRLGYVRGNVEVISWLANRCKSNLTPEQLVRFAQGILARNEKSRA